MCGKHVSPNPRSCVVARHACLVPPCQGAFPRPQPRKRAHSRSDQHRQLIPAVEQKLRGPGQQLCDARRSLVRTHGCSTIAAAMRGGAHQAWTEPPLSPHTSFQLIGLRLWLCFTRRCAALILPESAPPPLLAAPAPALGLWNLAM